VVIPPGLIQVITNETIVYLYLKEIVDYLYAKYGQGGREEGIRKVKEVMASTHSPISTVGL
jgi:hypothetical protein